MNTKEYINSRFEKILKENLDEKANSILNRLNYKDEARFNPQGDSFDYVQETKNGMCEECGGMMREGECKECGYKTEEIIELGGMDDGHPRFGNKNLSRMSRKEKEDLMVDRDYEMSFDDDDDEEYKDRSMYDPYYGDDEEEYYDELKIPSDMPSYKTKYRYSDDEEDLDSETDWNQLEEKHDYNNKKRGTFDDDLSFGTPYYEDPDDYRRRKDKESYEILKRMNREDKEREERRRERNESECTECGSSYEMKEKLYGQQHKLDRNKNGKIDREDFKMMRRKNEMKEKLYGNQHRIDKNKNGKIDREDFKMLRNQQNESDALYEIEFQRKDNKQKLKGKKNSVKESLIFTENELISFIEQMVNEEKKFKKSEPKGYKEYEKAHKADKKENEDYLKMVAKKMTDYLKGASDKGSKYEMKETKKFPTENGGKRKKYTPSDAVDEYIDAFSYPGQTNLVYDEIKPNDKWIEDLLKGSSRTGNAHVDKDGNPLGNVIPSEVGEKFYQNYKNNLYGQEQQEASYKRQPQPVDQAGEETERGSLKSKRGKKTSQGVLNKVEETLNPKTKNLVSEEFQRIQELIGYNRKTQ